MKVINKRDLREYELVLPSRLLCTAIASNEPFFIVGSFSHCGLFGTFVDRCFYEIATKKGFTEIDSASNVSYYVIPLTEPQGVDVMVHGYLISDVAMELEKKAALDAANHILTTFRTLKKYQALSIVQQESLVKLVRLIGVLTPIGYVYDIEKIVEALHKLQKEVKNV